MPDETSAPPPPPPPPKIDPLPAWEIPTEPSQKGHHHRLPIPATWAPRGGGRLDWLRAGPARWKTSLLHTRNRKRNLIVLAVISVLLLAFIIGLAVGLSRRKHSGTQNLPLPSNSAPHSGDLTYYAPALGACGITSSPKDHIVAVSKLVFDAAQKTSSSPGNPNANPLCGKMIRAKRFNEGKGREVSVDVKVVDRCVGCKATDLDLSPGAFDLLADEALGRVGVTWAWL